MIWIIFGVEYICGNVGNGVGFGSEQYILYGWKLPILGTGYVLFKIPLLFVIGQRSDIIKYSAYIYRIAGIGVWVPTKETVCCAE